MKLIILSLFFSASVYSYGQTENKPTKLDYNRWSIDGSIGLNNPVRNFSSLMYNTPLFNIGNAGLGVRYMFNAYGGLRLRATFNRFQDSKDSPSFATNHGRVELEGIINLGNALNFYEWTNRIGLLAHAGVGLGNLVEEGFPMPFSAEKAGNDRTGSLSFGLTPQIKLGAKAALNFDASVILLARNQRTFDYKTEAPSSGFGSRFFEGTIGFSYYLGKSESHADWSPTKSVNKRDLDALAAETEKMRQGMNDDDKDGVPNYLDQELNTPENTPVDAKGVTDLTAMDTDKDGVPDAYDACPEEKGPFSTNGCPDSDGDGVADKDDKCPGEKGSIATDGCAPKVSASNNGMGGSKAEVITYFETASYALSSSQKQKLDEVAAQLKANSSYTVVLSGHADARGDGDYNQSLSQNRANEAKKYLTKKGISASRIETKAYGYTQPAASNDTAEGQAKNRRVEVEIKK